MEKNLQENQIVLPNTKETEKNVKIVKEGTKSHKMIKKKKKLKTTKIGGMVLI